MRQGRAWFKSRTFRVGVVLVLMAGIGAYLSLRSARSRASTAGVGGAYRWRAYHVIGASSTRSRWRR